MRTFYNKFEKRFTGKLKEVFFYITYRCNLSCLHCYLGQSKNMDMDVSAFERMLRELVKLGASKITLLGGEPTLHPSLPQFIKIAHDLGVKYIRLDTNGQFNPNLLKISYLKFLDNISFSLDGIDPETHGRVRSIQNYYFVMKNIKNALSLGYNTRVTMTINSLNLFQIEEMASKLDKLGVSVLNLHLTSKNGRAKKNQWLLIKEIDWINFYNKLIFKMSKSMKYNIVIKIPKRYIKNGDFNSIELPTCEASKSSRLLITPDLKVYSCPLLLDKNKYFAQFKNGKFAYIKNYQKYLPLKLRSPACPLLMKENYSRYKKEKIIPICISHKHVIN